MNIYFNRPMTLCFLSLMVLASCDPATSSPNSIDPTPNASFEPSASATAEPTPDATPEATAEATPEATPTAFPSATPEATPTAFPSAEPDILLNPRSPELDGLVFPKDDRVFVNTANDPLSTFSTDVDTAAYTYLRSLLKANRLPSKGEIRTEEYINFFNYNYPSPQNETFGIYPELSQGAFGDPNTALLRIGIKGKELARQQREPAHLTFLIDVSGSMNIANRLELVKQSLALLVEQLTPADTISIVTYGSESHVKLRPTSDKNQILNVLKSLRPEGATDLESGITLAYQTAASNLALKGTHRVILCSDGVANVGATGPDELLNRIANQKSQGITLTALGFGMGEYNDLLMEQLSNAGDGQFHYVDTLAQAQRIFVENLTGTLQVIARDAKIQVSFDPAVVEQYRLLGYDNRSLSDEAFDNPTTDAGEIGSGHSITALYELRLRSGNTPNLGKVSLRFKENDRETTLEKPLQFESLSAFEKSSSSFQLAWTVAKYAELIKNPQVTTYGLDSLKAQSPQLLQAFPNGDVTEFFDLIQITDALLTQP